MPLDSSRQLGQTVGARLRTARLAKKYTQSQLAQPDFSVSYISAIERGQIQPSLRALEILAKRLDISTSDLLPQSGQTVLANQVIADNAASKEEEWEFLLLEAQIALHQGDTERAITLLRMLSEQKQDQDILLTLLLGQAYLKKGCLQESEQMLARIAVRAETAQDRLYPRILGLQSTVYAAMHNIGRAIQLQHESLALFTQTAISDIFFLAQAYNNLGQYYSYLGQFDQALAMFKQALATVQARTAYAQLQAAYRDLWLSYKDRNELPQMILASHKWLQADWRARSIELRSEIQHNLGRAWIKSRPEKAYDYLLVERQRAESQQNLLSQASASTHLAAWFVTHSEFSKAEPYAREALALAGPYGDTLIAAEASLLLGEIVYRREEYQDGDRYFASGLLMLENLGAIEELAEHSTRYAQLLEGRSLIHQAIHYWKKAYAYRQKSQEPAL